MKLEFSLKNVDKSIVIWGGGGHGHVVIDIIRAIGTWKIAGIIDSIQPAGAVVMGIPVLGDADSLSTLRGQGVDNMVVAVGDCVARAKMITQATSLGFELPSLAHPSAIVYQSASIGAGSVLCAGVIVGAQSKIGDGVIVNTRAVVDHDCQVCDYAHIAPGAILCGWISVGAYSWIGAGAVVRDHLDIGERVMVGVGSVVAKPVADGLTVYGNPGRVMEPPQ
jgi:sugar O-acyltransferase (sialic acid O-acetyltransferase NeuD family)